MLGQNRPFRYARQRPWYAASARARAPCIRLRAEAVSSDPAVPPRRPTRPRAVRSSSSSATERPVRFARPSARGREEKAFLRRRRAAKACLPPPINRDITISEGITVKELSEKLDVKANFVIKKLVDRGIFATINQTLDACLPATEICARFGNLRYSKPSPTRKRSMQDIEFPPKKPTDLFAAVRPSSPSWVTSITVKTPAARFHPHR